MWLALEKTELFASEISPRQQSRFQPSLIIFLQENSEQ